MKVATKGCPKCNGDIYLSYDDSDGFHEVYCMVCGCRDFPDEVGKLAFTLKKLKEKYRLWTGQPSQRP